MVNEEKLGTCEKHRRYYEKATKLYFKDGLGYRRISKIIPVTVNKSQVFIGFRSTDNPSAAAIR